MKIHTFLPLLALGCTAVPSAPPAPVGDAKPVEVTTISPQVKNLVRTIEIPAQIEAYEETPLIARIPGYVKEVLVDIGKEVKPGDLLAVIDVPEMQEELKQKQALVVQAEAEKDQAEAFLEIAEANVSTTKAHIAEAEAALGRAQANFDRWESENKRVEDLVQKQIIDKQIRDETKNQFRASEATRKEADAKIQSARAALKESEAKRNKARADLKTAQARIEVAQAEQARFRAVLQYAKITAPYDGVITQRNIHTGHYLQPGLQKPLFVIARSKVERLDAQKNPIKVRLLRLFLDVPETEALFVQDKVRAQIRVQTIRDRSFEGIVTRTSWSLDSKNRTLRAEIDLPNEDQVLRPGMYAYVTLSADIAERMTLPASAVLSQGDQSFVFLAENNKAVRVPVQLGLRGGSLVEVLKKQVKKGEDRVWESITGQEVVIAGPLAEVTDGASIRLP